MVSEDGKWRGEGGDRASGAGDGRAVADEELVRLRAEVRVAKLPAPLLSSTVPPCSCILVCSPNLINPVRAER